jgi:hypothetical protein
MVAGGLVGITKLMLFPGGLVGITKQIGFPGGPWWASRN